MPPAKIGFWLASEEHDATALVRAAQLAEEAGFDDVMISDHFHPWIEEQGQSPFVWAVIGGIASTTERIGLATAVTCPILRMHPVIVAHAAATAAAMMPGRFALGLGSGENLNEHVIGRGWPEPTIRREMFLEAIEIMREMFQGGLRNYRGRYFTVEDARLYTLPPDPPPILLAAGAEKSAEFAAEHGDGLVTSSPQEQIIRTFDQAGGKGKPKYTSFRVGWAKTKEEGRRTIHRLWPTSGIPGNVNFEIRLPKHFEEIAELVDEKAATNNAVVGPDPEPYAAELQKVIEMGYDHIAVHQVGPDQDGFIRFMEREVLPQVRRAPAQARAGRS